MSFSGIPGMSPAEETQADKDKKHEAAKREALQEAWERNAFNLAYFEKHPDWNPASNGWTNISDPEHNAEFGPDEVNEFVADGFGLSDANGTRLYPPGIYHYGHAGEYERGKEFNILLEESGMVRTIPNRGFLSVTGGLDKKAFNASFEATVDFLVGTQGARTILLNLPCGAAGGESPWRQQYNRSQLKNMIKVAHERGVAVEFDASTRAFISTLSPRDQERFYKARELLQVNSEKTKMMIGEGAKEGFEKKAVEFNTKDKLAAGATLEDFKDKVYGNPRVSTIDHKLNSIDNHLAEVEARSNAANRMTETLVGALKAQEKFLNDPSELRRGAILRLADHKTKGQQNVQDNILKRAKHWLKGEDKLTRFEDPDKVVDNIESRHKDSKMSRTALIGSVENEMKHLAATEKFLREELTALKADPAATDAQKARVDKQLQQVEKLKADLEPGKKGIEEAAKKDRDMPATIQKAREQVKEKKERNDAQRNAPTT